MKMNNIDAELASNYISVMLKNARIRKGITQKQAAELSGLSESTSSSIENCNSSSSPTLRSLIKYTEALEVKINIEV